MKTNNANDSAPRIMIICPEFPPEPSSSSIMAEQLSQALARDGYKVTVLTAFPNRPAGRVYAGFRRQFRKVEQCGDVRVIRCPNWLLGAKRRGLSRILENITFGLTSSLNALREPRPDLIIVETWPILAVQLNLWLGKILKTAVLYYIQDVYPEIAVDVGVLKQGSGLVHLLTRWDSRLCRQSSAVIAISETMKQLLCAERGIPRDQVRVIHNWADAEAIVPYPRLNAWRTRLNIPEDSFILMYAGILGLVSGVDILLDVARLVKDQRVHILCIGQGPLKAEMMRRAHAEALGNLSFLDFQEQADLPLMLATADAFFLPMRPGTRDASVPSKLISYLAAGRPVICATPPGAATLEVVRTCAAGTIVETGNAAAIAGAVSDLAANPSNQERQGRNARQAFEDHFEFHKSYRDFKLLIEEQSCHS